MSPLTARGLDRATETRTAVLDRPLPVGRLDLTRGAPTGGVPPVSLAAGGFRLALPAN